MLTPDPMVPAVSGENEEIEEESSVFSGRSPELDASELTVSESTPIAAPASEQTNDELLWRLNQGSVEFNGADFDVLFDRWKQTNDPRLRERLILMHRNMVTYLARRFVDRGEMFEDVMQIGMLGLVQALDGFDPARGLKFSTFAIPTISGEIRRYFRDKASTMRVPRRLHELHQFLQNHVEEMTQSLDRSPTYAEIAASLQIDVEEVVEALELGHALDPHSIDDAAFGDSEGATIGDSIGTVDPDLRAYEENSELIAALEKLEPRQRQVLEMAYFNGHSQVEIARRLNVSQMHISRLLRRSLAALRQFLDEG